MDNWYNYSWEERKLVQDIIDEWLETKHYREPEYFSVTYRNNQNSWWLAAYRAIFTDIAKSLEAGKKFAANNPNKLVKVSKGDIVIALYAEGKLVYFNVHAYEWFTKS